MRCAVFVALVCAMLAGGSSSAFAAFTPYTPITQLPTFPSEAQTITLLQTTYAPSGPTFAKVGEDYTNGTISATRIADRSLLTLLADGFDPVTNAVATFGGNLNGIDQLWQANFSSARAEAIFGRFSQSFGYFDGSSGGTFHSLFNASGTGFGVTGSATITSNSLTDTIIRWARGGENGIFSSQESDNPDLTDHMITFRIEGLNNGVATWLLMFEDKKPGQEFYDEDYNDLVVQIEASPVPIPEPASLGLLLIGGVATLARRRRA